MPLYESTFIVRHDMSTQDADKLADELSGIVKENSGKVVKKEYWGLRNLCYRINKNRKGHYYMLGIDGPASAIKELERKARLNEDVMRNLTIKVESISDKPSQLLEADNDE